MRGFEYYLSLSCLLTVLTLNSIVRAMVDPCHINNITVWVSNRPVVTRYNCQSNVRINATDLKDAPDLQYVGPSTMSDRYTFMMLKNVPSAPMLFDVHWFVANISPDRDFFLTRNKTNATQFFVYKRPTPGDYQIFLFKQISSGSIPNGPGFTSDHLFSLNRWMDNNVNTVSNMIGGVKFQVVNVTAPRPGNPSPFYPPVPVPIGMPGGQPPQQPPYNPQYQPPPQHGSPQSQPYPQPGHNAHPSQAQNTTQVVHHYHHHETVKKKKNSSPALSICLALLGISTLVPHL